MSDILISVEHRHVENMLNGSKTIELRRRPVRVQTGTNVWIYSKMPYGKIETIGTVERIIEASPTFIWNNYKTECGVTQNEFDDYFKNTDIAYAIVFSEILRLRSNLTLQNIRNSISTFHPPQFFKRLSACSPELMYFRSKLGNQA